MIEASLLDRARPKRSDDRLMRLVAGIKAAAPSCTRQQIAAELVDMHETTPQLARWHSSSFKHLLTRAERFGWPASGRAGSDRMLRPGTEG